MTNIARNIKFDFIDRPIICYKHKSMGLVKWEFNSVREFFELEAKSRGIKPKVDTSLYYSIYCCANGRNGRNARNARMTSFYLGCFIVIKFKNERSVGPAENN